jgi:hypothetical protein
MKFKKLITTNLLILVCIILTIPFCKGFWGEGDCTKAHPLEYINIPNDPDAEIILDGVPSESFWRSERNKAGNLVIPLASNINKSNFFIVYLNSTFILSNDYIFILFEWDDNTTIPIGGSINDGLYICWNINVPNFSSYFINGMNTTHMGGGNVDCWSLNINQDSPQNGSSYFCQDLCFGDNGWYNPSLEFEDVLVAYNYVQNQSYTLEMKRKISTEDKEYDVQFNKKTLYKFNLGIMDNAEHEDHAISWTYALDLREPKIISGFYIEYFILSMSIFLYLVFIIKYKNKINR